MLSILVNKDRKTGGLLNASFKVLEWLGVLWENLLYYINEYGKKSTHQATDCLISHNGSLLGVLEQAYGEERTFSVFSYISKGKQTPQLISVLMLKGHFIAWKKKRDVMAYIIGSCLTSYLLNLMKRTQFSGYCGPDRSILKTTFQTESYLLVTKQNQDLEILRGRTATYLGLFQMKALRPFPSC